MVVSGKILGFQKGKVFLEKIKDTLLVKVDSITLDGQNKFTLTDNIENPQVYYISISESDKYLKFFGEKGEISIIDDLKSFGFNPIISGSENQLVYDEYLKMKKKFNNSRLDLFKNKIQSKQFNDSIKQNKIEQKLANLERRRYLYTINFVTKHANLEIAPYLVLTEIPNVNITLLDTVYKVMTPKIKQSIYGKKFVELLNKQNQ